MKRHLVTLTVLGAMAAAMAIAQTAPAAPVRARMHARHAMMQSLDLSAAQKQQAKTIFQNTRQQVQPIAQQLRQDRQAMRAAEQAGDTAQINQLSTAMGTLEGQMIAARSAGRSQFLALLTPDQKAKAAQAAPKKGE